MSYEINANQSIDETNVVGIFERFLRNVIEREIETYGCDQLSTTGAALLNDQLPPSVDDILLATSSSSSSSSSNNDAAAVVAVAPIIPDDCDDVSKALHLQEIGDTKIGRLIEMTLKEVDELLGGGGSGGGDAASDDDGGELGINNLLRSYVLKRTSSWMKFGCTDWIP